MRHALLQAFTNASVIDRHDRYLIAASPKAPVYSFVLTGSTGLAGMIGYALTSAYQVGVGICVKEPEGGTQALYDANLSGTDFAP